MANTAPVLSSNDIDVDRTLATSRDASASQLTIADFDIDGTAEHICRGFCRVALQLPDELLHHAESIVAALTDAIRQRRADASASSPPPELFVLADTSFDGFQVDFVAAQHLEADMVVHYGPADLQAQGPMAVRFVFGRRHIDPRALTAAFADAFAPSSRVLLVFALAYEHASHEVAQALGVSHPEAVVCVAEIEQAAAEDSSGGGGSSVEGGAGTEAAARGDAATGEADGGDVGGGSDSASIIGGRGGECTLLGRRLPRPLSQADLAECALVYVGEEDASLANLCVLLSHSDVFVYAPPPPPPPPPPPQPPQPPRASSQPQSQEPQEPQTPPAEGGGGGAAATTIQRLVLPTAKRMMRRYYLVQQAREAAVVGLLVGSLSVAQRKPMLRALRDLCRRCGRKHYVFIMGKLNAAKLANFAEVGVYVLLGSPEHSLLDSKSFYRPVVTPFELQLALSNDEWSGEYILDYARLLPRLAPPPPPLAADAAADAATADAADAATDPAKADADADDDDGCDLPPDHSLLSGRLLPAATPASAAAASAGGGILARTADGTLATAGGAFALAHSGAEALARRHFRGLDVRLGEHAPAVLQEGWSGIASGFAAASPTLVREVSAAAAAAAAAAVEAVEAVVTVEAVAVEAAGRRPRPPRPRPVRSQFSRRGSTRRSVDCWCTSFRLSITM